MIEAIKLTNFQKHKKLSIVFDPNITTIVGESDRGKSSIVRALGFLLLGDPNGDDLIRNGSAELSVAIKVDDQKLERRRGKKNLYVLGEKEFHAIRNEIPSEVQVVSKCCEENFQTQTDLYFWFLLPPAQLSRELNKLIDLQKIDQSLEYCAVEIRKSKSQVKFTEQQLSELKNEERKLVQVPTMLAAFAELEKTHSLLLRLRNSHDLLLKQTEAAKKLNVRVRRSKAMLEAWEEVEVSHEKPEQAQRRERLSSLIDSMKDAQKYTEQTDMAPAWNSLSTVKREGTELGERIIRLSQLIEEGNRAVSERAKLKVSLSGLEETLEKEMKGKCPICQKKF